MGRNKEQLAQGQGGRRMAKKMTNKQIAEEIARLSATQQGLIRAVSQDIDRLNVITFALLKELGKAEQTECDGCKQMIFRPMLKEIELENVCPSCGGDLEKQDDDIDTAVAEIDTEPMDEEE